MKKRYMTIAAGIALVLCLAAVFGGSCLPYDPAGAGGDESFLECCAVCCVVAGVMLLPVASVCFAKRLFAGRRFRFALSWLVGFLIPWSLLVYATYFPGTPPEGSYCTEAEQCVQFAIFIAIVTGVINAVDSLVERLLRKLSTPRILQMIMQRLLTVKICHAFILSAVLLAGCISGSSNCGGASDAEDEAEDIVKTISSWLEPYKGALGVTVQRDGSSTYLYTTFGTFSSVFNRFHLAFVVDCEEREVQCYGYLPTIVPEGRRSEMAEFIFRGEWEYGISTASIVLEGDGSVRCQAWSPFESFALQPKETEWRLMGAVVDKLWSFSEGVARVALGGDPVVAAGEVKRIAFFEGKVGAAGLENSAEDDTKIVLERCFDEDHEIEVSDSTDEWLEALSGHGGDEHVGIIKARIEDIARYLGGRYDVLPYSLVVKDGMVWNVCNVPEDCPSEIIRDVADALMKINQGLKYAMFGIDFNTGRIWSHYAVPVPVIPDRDEKPRRNLYAAFILMKTVQSIAQNSEVLHSAMIRAWSSFDCDEERSNDKDGGIDNEQE